MPGGRSNSKALRYVGVLAAIVGVVGYLVFGWRFGDGDVGLLPLVLGIGFAIFAVGWTISQRRRS